MADEDNFGTWGCVIGRFQPFHNDHLSLVQEVAMACGRVIVAVTNVEPSWRVPVAEAPHRHVDAANPFSYWQRAEMIHASLEPILLRQRYRVTPFPIQDPAAWDAYLPDNVECWVRDRGPWEARKARELAARYRVRTFPAVANEVSGTAIREQIALGDPIWEQAVPTAVAKLMNMWRIDGTGPR